MAVTLSSIQGSSNWNKRMAGGRKIKKNVMVITVEIYGNDAHNRGRNQKGGIRR